MLFDGPENSPHTYVVAHGAGGAMDTPWMNKMARALAARSIRVVRFEFPYMARRRKGEGGRAPDRQPVLLDSWRNVIRELGGGERLFIGGKSMGGRMASMVADDEHVRGLICLGYPFHPPNQPERTRTAHLESLYTPTLIIQGSRDQFGNQDDVRTYHLSPSIRVEWIEGGDHSFKPPARSGVTESQTLSQAVELIVQFIEST